MSRNKTGVIIALGTILLIITGIIFISFQKETSSSTTPPSEPGKWIESVSVDKARFLPGESVTIRIDINNTGKSGFNGDLQVRIKYLHDLVKEQKFPVSLKGEEKKTIEWKWESDGRDFTGYSVEAWLIKAGKPIDLATTAIDVSSNWGKFPRYGYITDFGKKNSNEIDEIISWLNHYHINGLQYYDWQWKHHQPLKEVDETIQEKWKDIANRDIYLSTLEGYLTTAHQYGMVNMNYNLLFGAYSSSATDGVKQEWGLFKDLKHSISDAHLLPSIWATSKLLIMNPSDPGWMEYILQEEKRVFQFLPFDGWHVDQLGDRGRLYDYNGKIVRLDETYAPFLQRAKQELNISLVMNAVNQYGQMQIATESPVDFLYTEVWPSNFNTYGHLKQVIDMNRNFSQGKLNSVLAAYMNYGMANSNGYFNTPGVLMTDSVIFAAGGAHIELGDTGMLSKEYFPHHLLKMDDQLKNELLHYYNFLVAYENLLRDQVSEIDLTVTSDEIHFSKNDQPGSVWYFAKEKPGYLILHLLNLVDQTERLWRDDQGKVREPKNLENIPIKVYLSEKIKGVYLSSPNINQGISMSLQFHQGIDEEGEFIEFTVPSLKYWDMVYFEKE